ncbi:zinc finger protein ZAT5 [Solanum lycopersicum]|uniref:C2H2-type domain-containing protein n=1 Tax=Solanum lycopersicum TaxID=4081 RepID=A0A3Q7HYQ7_SOLLC|nr:zinc finger protein ZAT5 [Solanum lycopersicum]
MIKIKKCYTMEVHDDRGCDQDQQLNMVIKRRRTKRPRPPSPLTLGITTSSCSTVEGASSGELVDGHVANSLLRSNNCGGMIDDKIVRNTNQEEEDMANCLILLAQGHNFQKSSSLSQSPTLDVYQCKTCNRSFPSFQALGGHRASHKKPKTLEDQIKNLKSNDHHHHQQAENNIRLKLNNNDDHVTTLSLQIPNNSNNNSNNKNKNRVHECSICGAEFNSGQALGGHMRRHRPLPNSIAITSNHHIHEESHHHHHHDQQIIKNNTRAFLSLDLNLPAPEDDHRPENSKFTFATKEQVIVFSASSLVDCHY